VGLLLLCDDLRGIKVEGVIRDRFSLQRPSDLLLIDDG
jgi:hypothetical protein